MAAPIPSSGKTSQKFYSKKVWPKVPKGSYNIGHITYKLNVLGTRGLRQMQCVMHSISLSSLSVYFSNSLDYSMDFSSSRFSEIYKRVDGDEEEKTVIPLVLKNKPLRWHEHLQCWCLNFRGHVMVALVKNFQLIACTKPVAGALASSQPTPAVYSKIILQFGKVSKEMFTMDYNYPLSTFQAFAICLSGFDTKLASNRQKKRPKDKQEEE